MGIQPDPVLKFERDSSVTGGKTLWTSQFGNYPVLNGGDPERGEIPNLPLVFPNRFLRHPEVTKTLCEKLAVIRENSKNIIVPHSGGQAH